MYKLVFYQRDRTRRFEQFDETLRLVELALPSSQWEIHALYHDNDRSPCELAHILQDADVLVTPHGFQSTLLLLLPTPALLFEVFPNPYYKPPYKQVAQSMGIMHGLYSSAPTSWLFTFLQQVFNLPASSCNRYYLCRDLARRQNVMYVAFIFLFLSLLLFIGCIARLYLTSLMIVIDATVVWTNPE